MPDLQVGDRVELTTTPLTGRPYHSPGAKGRVIRVDPDDGFGTLMPLVYVQWDTGERDEKWGGIRQDRFVLIERPEPGADVRAYYDAITEAG